MKRKNNLLTLCIVIICVAFAALLIFSEALVARHECVDDHCVLCAISLSFKFVSFTSACALVSLACTIDVPRAELNGTKRFTLVSSKAKLTI